MKTPTKKEAISGLATTGSQLAGMAAPHALLKIVKKNGLIYSLLITVAGLALSIMGPKPANAGEKKGTDYKLREFGQGVALYGIVTTLNEMAKDTINLGLGSVTPMSLKGLALPQGIRDAIKNYVPNLSGLPAMTIYPPNYKIPGDTTVNPNLKGVNLPSPKENMPAPTSLQLGSINLQF
ncbi:MAG: hypothetical protein V4538_01750 [Bacteroidota bacterium]